MLTFTADPRDASSGLSKGCNSCCCSPATARPGERNKWMINYAPWSAPLTGQGITDRVAFDLDKMEQEVDPRAPVNTNYYFPAEFNDPFNGSVATAASDPLDGELTYRLHGLFEPERGDVVVSPDGTFVYTPTLGFSGYDSFYVVTANEAKEVVTQVIVGVAANAAPALPAKNFDPVLYVHQRSVQAQNEILTFQLAASPSAVVGDRYRLTIRATAIDCDCQEYFHISCYDIVIVSC